MGTACRKQRGGGGARRDRTADLLHAMQALSQLSYSPTREARNVGKQSFSVKKTFSVQAANFNAREYGQGTPPQC